MNWQLQSDCFDGEHKILECRWQVSPGDLVINGSVKSIPPASTGMEFPI